ncbi:hypothetical protein BpHYR1_045383 [Brachionus plicatilis]|uniref:Uncharacterized protein n=1 Tax=Brachionus plicatilis TaxID=10195 RepID=A0A3M7PTX5_BRAPC|nr:hypothetical protein BpHYR1_045383 [Brachionus plicatilis]
MTFFFTFAQVCFFAKYYFEPSLFPCVLLLLDVRIGQKSNFKTCTRPPKKTSSIHLSRSQSYDQIKN